MQKLTVSPVSLTNSLLKVMRALETNGNSLIAIYAVCQLNPLNFGNIACNVSESNTIIADAKNYVTSLKDHKALPENSEIIREGRMLQKSEQSVIVAILITEYPVNEQFIKQHSLAFVAKNATKAIPQPVS